MKKGKILIILMLLCIFAGYGQQVMAILGDAQVQMAWVVDENASYDNKYKTIPADVANRGSVLGKEHPQGATFWVTFGDMAYLSYCIGYGREISTSDVLEPWPDANLNNGSGDIISDEIVEQLEYVLKFGFVHSVEAEKVNPHFEGDRGDLRAEQYMASLMKDNIIPEAQDKNFATQIIMWATSEGYFEDYDKMIQILRSFCNGKNDGNGNPFNRAKDIYDKAYKTYQACKNEKAVNFDKTYKMTWDENEQVYKAVITEDNYKYILDDMIKGKVTSSNSNLKFKVEENKITITSTVPIGTASSPVTCTFTREVGENEGTCFFGQADYTSGGDDPQPLAVFREGDMPPETHNFSVYTELGNLKIEKVDEHGKPVPNCEFTIVGPYGFNETLKTDENGVIELNEINVGTYTITEVYVEGNLYINESNVNVEVNVEGGRTVTFRGENPYKRGSAQLLKRDAYEDTDPKGDSILEGAEYKLYAAEDIYEGSTLLFKANEEIAHVSTDKTGATPVVKNVESEIANKELDGLPIGSYYWKETKASKGFNLNNEIINFEITNDDLDDLYEADMDTVVKKHLEIPIKGKVQVIKMDNDNNNDDSENDTDKNSATGAQLRLALESDPSEYYDVEIDENGYANFVDEDFKERYPDVEFTIPYGKYELIEIKESDSGESIYYYIQDTTVTIDYQDEVEERIVMDEPVPMYLQVIKKDLEDKTTVALAGAGFKIWSINDGEFVSLYDSQQDKEIDTFYTGENGYFVTPRELYAGEYIVYEVQAPEGYALKEEWKIPENEADLGDPEKGGKYVKIDKQALEVAEDAEFPGIDAGDLIYEIEMTDKRVKGTVTVHKTGPVITDVNMISGEHGVEKRPVYANQGLEGVTYDIYTAEPIVSPDGRTTYEEANVKVDTLKTDGNGYAQSKELDLGKYYAIEVDSEDDRVIINDDPVYFELKYEGQDVPVVTENLELENENKNAKLTFDKIFEESIYDIKEEKYAVFGVYAGHDIKDYKGKVVINNGDLIQTIELNNNITVEETLNLPEGEYYYQEIIAAPSYTKDESKYAFTIDYEEDAEIVEIEGKTVKNEIEDADLMLIKLSTSSFIDETGIYGSNDIDKEKLDALSQELLDEIKSLSKDQLIKYLEENTTNYLLSGAEYSIYLDEECTKPLKLKDGTEVKITTDEYGLAEVKELPLGVYYLKETKAPAKAELSNEVIQIELTTSDTEVELAYRLLVDKSITFTFEKIDIFTGDRVKDCKFIITDEDNNKIVEMTTNESGIAEIPIDMFDQGKTYYYQEIEAPDIYKEDGKLYTINTEKHPFVLDYTIDYENEKLIWNNEDKEEVDNYRPVIEELVVKKTDEETGEPLQGCKFSIVLLDENGDPYVNEAGETVYLVKDAITDENGEYRVEKPVYGTYRFIEVEAPEGYDLEEQNMEGYEFTIDDNTPDTLIFEVTNTGDIAVIAIVSVALVSMAGIIFVVIRNRKSRKNV